VSVTGLLRTQAEIHRASPSVADSGEVDPGYALIATARCTVRRAGGGRARGPAGEFVAVESVAYFPAGTDVRPEGHGQTPDRVRLDGRDYVCAFVDRGPGRGAPVRVGLRPVS
jgi:hypothetical protein